MKYKIKTELNLSMTEFLYSIVFSIYGTGQESAASPTVWKIILNILINIYNK